MPDSIQDRTYTLSLNRAELSAVIQGLYRYSKTLDDSHTRLLRTDNTDPRVDDLMILNRRGKALTDTVLDRLVAQRDGDH